MAKKTEEKEYLYREEEIRSFIELEGLKPNSGLELVNKEKKTVYINQEEFLSRFALYLKGLAQLKN